MTNEQLRAPATEDEWADYHAIRRRVLFELRGIGVTYDPHHPDEHRPGHYPLVFWDGSVPVGVIRVDVEGPVAIFRRVAIRDDVQRRGLGRRLLRAAEKFATEQGCTRIESHVDPSAVTFYERCGFARLRAAGAGGATVLMTKSVDQA